MTRPWILLLLLLLLSLSLVACKSKQKPTTEPAGSAAVGSATTDAAMVDAGAVAVVVDATVVVDAAAAAAAEPGCEGWRVRKIEELGMGARTVSMACAGGKVTLTATLDSSRGDAETETKIVPRAAWLTLWQQLEAAGWRTLDPTCPTVTPAPESMSITGLELTISDGKTTKEIKCDGVNVTAVHEQIMKALDDVAE